MKLALVRYSLAGTGGAENTVLALTRELLRLGHRITLVTAAPAPGLAHPALEQIKIPVWPGKSGRILGFVLHSRRFLRQEPFDLIFSLERTLYQTVYRAGDGCHREWLARRRPYDSFWSRWLLPLNPFHRLVLGLEQRLLQDPGLRLVIANSRMVGQELQRHYQVPVAKIRVIYNGVDQDRFNPSRLAALRAPACSRFGLDPTIPYLLFLGSGFKRKGLRFAIEALPRLEHKRAHLLIVGKDRPEPYLRLARRLAVAERVRFLGVQREPELCYAVARVVVLPTLYDPCSNVVLEALAGGRPVLTTQANGAAEFIWPGANGVVLSRPEAVAELAAAGDEFLARSEDAAVKDAAVAAVADLSWRRTVAETLTALLDLVK